MSMNLAIGLGVGIWAIVFVFLLISLAVSADVERRWDETWAIEWEKRNGASIDVLLGRLSQQVSRWRLGRRLLNIYLWLGVLALAAVAALQLSRWPMSAAAFRDVMVFGLALVGLILLPFRFACEIGLGLVEGMYRQARAATGERLVVEGGREIDAVPKEPKRGKGRTKAGAGEE